MMSMSSSIDILILIALIILIAAAAVILVRVLSRNSQQKEMRMPLTVISSTGYPIHRLYPTLNHNISLDLISMDMN